MTFHPKISLNGALVEAGSALISVDERGFRFGDGIFETIPIHDGNPYLWEYHIKRLNAGLSALGIPDPAYDLREKTLQLVKANQVTKGLVRLYISRGTGSRGYLPASSSAMPTTIIQTLELPQPPAASVSLWLSGYEKISPRALPTHCKLAQGLNPTLARMEANTHGCYDALQLDSNGYIAEASSANLFWLSEEKLYTPSLASGALAGVTRQRIMELSPYPVCEGLYGMDALQAAEAMVLTNTALGIIPVGKLLPANITWKSDALAAGLTTLRNQDIIKVRHR